MQVQETAAKYLTRKRNYTDQEYRSLPPDDFRYQLIDRELVRTPAPSVVHQEIVRNLAMRLIRFVEEGKLGKVYFAPCDVKPGKHNVVQPDIFYISRENQQIVHPEAIHGAPDLVMEVLSSSTGYLDMVDKKKLYARAGVKEYWIVNPQMAVGGNLLAGRGTVPPASAGGKR